MRRFYTMITIGLMIVFTISIFTAAQVEAKAEAEQPEGVPPFGEATKSGPGLKLTGEFYVKYTGFEGTTIAENAEVVVRLSKGNEKPWVFFKEMIPNVDILNPDEVLNTFIEELEGPVCNVFLGGPCGDIRVNKIDISDTDTALDPEPKPPSSIDPLWVLGTIGVVLEKP